MDDAVIVDAVRTPAGKRGGSLSGWHPAELAAELLVALQTRTGIDPALVDDVIMGCVTQVGPQSTNIARTCELERAGGRYGLQTMCEGGGMANASIIERLD